MRSRNCAKPSTIAAIMRQRRDACSLRPNSCLVRPARDNRLEALGRGVFLCISPWNFPLAIFLGQIAAALVAGNSVVAKPAEQTPLIAAEAIRALHRCWRARLGSASHAGRRRARRGACRRSARRRRRLHRLDGSRLAHQSRARGQRRARSCRSLPKPAASMR